MEKQYAQAIDHLIRERGMDEKKVFEQLLTHLRTTGRIKLLPLLQNELEKLQMRKSEQALVLEVASMSARKGAEAYAEKVNVHAAIVENSALITGWRLRGDGKLVDRSGKRALIDLYRRITA